MNYTVINGNNSGAGSLRNAIEQANSGSDSIITVQADVENILITEEEMEITSSMTIVYEGSDKVTITRINDSIGRIFFITNGADVTMDKLVIEGGISTDNTNGGAILINSSSKLNMNDCIMQNNSITGPNSRGGCINITGSSTITMNDCIMQNNSTTGSGSEGGCIFIEGSSSVAMNKCLAQNNSSGFATGFAVVGSGSTLQMYYCRINNNTARAIGAIYNIGAITLDSCTFDGNNADGGNNGAIYSQGNVIIRNCTISNNSANGAAGGIRIDTIGGQTTIVNSTFTENTSSNDNGGAIYINSASGISVAIINCTISNNTAVDGGGIHKASGDSILVLQNTIVAGNFGTSYPDILGDVSSPVDSPSGYNLIGDGNGSNMFDGIDGNQVGSLGNLIDPKLNPLGNYGGPTQTMTLKLSESPAHDAGNTSYVPDDVHFDQRGPGYPRIQDGNVNIGATEGTTLCYSGESLVLTKTISDNKVGITKAKDVSPNEHLVFDVANKGFVPVRLNVITGPTNRYMLIKKDSLGRNKPSSDFYVTSGHRLVIDGFEVKARDVPQAKRVKVNNEKVYTICLDKRSVIRVNNLDVIAFDYDEWIDRSKKKSIN